MIDIQRRITTLKYLVGFYPRVWQLPNAIKIHEFVELERTLATGPDRVILDLGCGRGMQSQLLARNGARVTGIEPNEKRYKLALRELKNSKVRKSVEFFNGTLDEAGLKAETFDSVISFCVLEHIPNLDEVLKNLHLILKKDGELHATVDSLSNINDPALLEKHRTEHAVVRYFTLDTIEEVLNRAGFDVTEKRFILTSELAKKRLIAELETGDYLEKPRARKVAFEKLVDSEALSETSNAGTMILVRARKI